jgi:hypothetical protein
LFSAQRGRRARERLAGGRPSGRAGLRRRGSTGRSRGRRWEGRWRTLDGGAAPGSEQGLRRRSSRQAARRGRGDRARWPGTGSTDARLAIYRGRERRGALGERGGEWAPAEPPLTPLMAPVTCTVERGGEGERNGRNGSGEGAPRRGGTVKRGEADRRQARSAEPRRRRAAPERACDARWEGEGAGVGPARKGQRRGEKRRGGARVASWAVAGPGGRLG